MATKEKIEKLDRLLVWDREKRLPVTKELFNRKIAETLFLREIDEKLWLIEGFKTNEETGEINRVSVYLKHKTLIQLGLSIIDAVSKSEKRNP
jgi:hypothetical protein